MLRLPGNNANSETQHVVSLQMVTSTGRRGMPRLYRWEQIQYQAGMERQQFAQFADQLPTSPFAGKGKMKNAAVREMRTAALMFC